MKRMDYNAKQRKKKSVLHTRSGDAMDSAFKLQPGDPGSIPRPDHVTLKCFFVV